MLYSLVIVPILAGVLNVLFRKRDTRIVSILFQSLVFIYSIYLFVQVRVSGPVYEYMSNLPPGIAITLRFDTLASVMVVLTASIFLVLLLFAYHKPYFTNLFAFLFLVLQGLINALFLSADLFNIFIMLEVSTVVVSILIMFNKEKQAIYDGMIYFFVNVIGTAFLLFGIAMLYNTTGLLDMEAIQQSLVHIENPQTMLLPYALMMTTLSLKIAAVPLFSWLPKAHGTPSAPPVVSAVLSGLYIKTGLYLLIRFNTMYSEVIQLREFFLFIGILTSLFGIVMAIGQTDLKMVLAYSTVSQIGLIVIGLTIGAEEAYWGSLFHLMSHALFKTSLFLAAGQVIDVYGTRNLTEIRGVMRQMPLTGMAVLLGILGITGAPFFNGSISKYLIGYGSDAFLFQLAANLINLGTITYFIKFGSILFGSRTRQNSLASGSVDRLSEVVLLILSSLILLSGIFSEALIQVMFDYRTLVFTAAYVEKSIIYLLMAIAGLGFYKGIIKNNALLNSIGHLEVTFNGIITSMVGFFVVIALYAYMVI